jgi:hypothetical protein
MIKINLVDVWGELVDGYYKNVQPAEHTSIWGYVEKNYNGKITRTPQRRIQLTFENDSDATVFKLKFGNSSHT